MGSGGHRGGAPESERRGGNTHLYDSYIAQLTAAAGSRKLFVTDVYDSFLALPEATLLSYYLDPTVDYAHLNDTGCAQWAQVVGNSIVAQLGVTSPAAPTPAATAGAAAAAVSQEWKRCWCFQRCFGGGGLSMWGGAPQRGEGGGLPSLLLNFPLPPVNIATRAAKIGKRLQTLRVAAPEDLLHLKKCAYADRKSAADGRDLEFLQNLLKERA